MVCYTFPQRPASPPGQAGYSEPSSSSGGCSLNSIFTPKFWLAALLAFVMFSMPVLAQNSPVTISSDETLFAVLAAINNCGFDVELGSSDTLRQTIRGEIGRNLETSDTAKSAADAVCSFYRDHQQQDASRTLSQYISLALYLTAPPVFAPKVKESDLPPDASGVLGFVPLLNTFYTEAGVHKIWQQQASDYAELAARYHGPLDQMIRNMELYLRLPTGGYLGRTFHIYIEPMGAPSEINARNYGTEYFVVVTPGTNPDLKLEQIRHTYLHYLLDPVVGKYSGTLNILDPVLEAVKLAPMDESFKSDASLLVTECVIRAIEARTLSGGKAPLGQQEQAVQDSMSQGFVLTRYFYEKLLDFEKDDIGFRNALPPMLSQIDVPREKKRASQVEFANQADPELLQLPSPKEGKLLSTAEERLTAGDSATAEKLAKQALAEKTEDPGRALFILAEISLNGNMDNAQDYFEQALKVTAEPKVVAWSHIYLGRILDLRDQNENGPLRAQAIAHYKAAVTASDTLPGAKAAAQKGVDQPFQAPHSSEQSDN